MARYLGTINSSAVYWNRKFGKGKMKSSRCLLCAHEHNMSTRQLGMCVGQPGEYRCASHHRYVAWKAMRWVRLSATGKAGPWAHSQVWRRSWPGSQQKKVPQGERKEHLGVLKAAETVGRSDERGGCAAQRCW